MHSFFKIFVTIVFFLLTNLSFAQIVNSLKKEVIYKSKMSSGDLEYLIAGKAIFAYDNVGRITSESYYSYSQENSWEIRNKSLNTYDESGRMILNHFVTYHEGTMNSERIEQRDYIDVCHERITNTNISYNLPSKIKRITDNFYNDNGLLVSSIVKEDRIESGSQVFSLQTKKWYYKETNLFALSESTIVENPNGILYQTFDSTSIEKNYSAGSRIETYTYWQKLEPEAVFTVRGVHAFEFLSNIQGKDTLIVYKRKIVNSDWSTLRITKQKFSNSGVKVFFEETEINNLRKTEYFNERGKLIFQGVEDYNEDLDQWLAVNEKSWEYDESDILLSSLVRSDAFEKDGVLREFEERIYEYNEHKMLERIVYKGHKKDYLDVYQDYMSQRVYNYRCDGAQISDERTVLEGNDITVLAEAKLTETNYYDLPPCASLPAGQNIITMAPNPATYYVNLYALKPFGQSQISIIDSFGREIKNGDYLLNNYISIDLLDFKPGLYIISIEGEDEAFSNKLMVQ